MCFLRSLGFWPLFGVLPLSDGWVCRAAWYLCAHGLSVASSLQEARPIPGSCYLTPLGKFWPPPFSSPQWCNTGRNSPLFSSTVCPAITNQLWTFKLNYFPQTEHIIPHMNKLLLLLLSLVQYKGVQFYNERAIYILYRGRTWLRNMTFLQTNLQLEIPTEKANSARVNLSHAWLGCTCFDPGNPWLRRGSHFGTSIAQSKGCNYNLSNGIISPSFSTHSVFA